MKEQKRNGFGARRLVILALFTALAYVVMLAVRLPVSFLTMDVKDAIITLCGLYFGPLAAVIVSLIVSFVDMLSGSATGWYGFAMNFLGSAVFSATAALIYRYKKDLMGAIVGLSSGVFAMTAIMLIFNLIVTPRYLSCPTSEVVALIPTLLLPFNLVKGVLNAGLVMLLYKPMSEILRRSGFLPSGGKGFRFDRRTVMIMAVSLLVIVVSLVIIFAVLGGRFELGFGK